MVEMSTLEKAVIKSTEPWGNFPEHKPVPKPEVSKVYGWPDISRNGGGDIDSADYALRID